MERELTLGAKVRASDGEAGELSKIITDPRSHEPTYLVVKRGRLFPREVLVPTSLVTEVTEQEVKLDLDKEALDGFPDYEITVQKGEYRKPLVGGFGRPRGVYTPPSNSAFMVLRQRNVPEHSVEVTAGMAVRDARGVGVGTVEGLLVDPDRRQGSHLVVRPSGRPSPSRVLPVELVAEVDDSGVALRLERDQIEGLPIFSEG